MHLLAMSPDQWDETKEFQKLCSLQCSAFLYAHNNTHNKHKGQKLWRWGWERFAFILSEPRPQQGVGGWCRENLGLKTLPEFAYTLVHHLCPAAFLHPCQFPSPPYKEATGCLLSTAEGCIERGYRCTQNLTKRRRGLAINPV